MSWEIRQGDCLAIMAQMEPDSVDCVVTSPPYWGLRDYGDPKAWGLEPTLDEYLERMGRLGESLMRALKPSGTFWLNMGDAYSGSGRGDGGDARKQTTNAGSQFSSGLQGNVPHGLKPKDLIGLPWRVAFLLQAQGWYLRSEIIWHKPNPMPESVRDRPTKAHEQIFLLAKSPKYFYDADAIAEPSIYAVDDRGSRTDNRRDQPLCNSMSGMTGDTRNARTVWTIATQAYPEAHFATFPEEIPKRCILAGSPIGGLVYDPFGGSGTTMAVAVRLGRNAICSEVNPQYVKLIERRMEGVTPSLFGEA